MKAARLALLALACTLPLAAAAQWQWVDKSGHKVFSDQAPPADVPAEKILKGPRGMMPVAATASAATQAAAPVAAPVVDNAPMLPKVAGKDKALEERKKQVEAAEAEKKKAEEQKLAQARSENCSKAKSSKANYDSGIRLARVNDKGEREILDDEARAKETRMLEAVIARDCPPRQ